MFQWLGYSRTLSSISFLSRKPRVICNGLKMPASFLCCSLLLLLCLLPSARPANRNSIERRKPFYNETVMEELTTSSSSASSGCGACRMREENKLRSLEFIKSNVLKKMGFQTAPNITGRVLPQVSLEILKEIEQEYFEKMQGDQPHYRTGPFVHEEDDDYHVKTQRVISFAQPYPRLRHSWKDHDIIFFQLSESITKHRITNATLRIFVKGLDRRPLPSFRVEVFKVYKDEGRPEAPGFFRMAAKTVAQPLGEGGYVAVDITEMVSEWCKSPRENFGFVINGTLNGRKVVVTNSAVDGRSQTPYVEIETMEPKRRTRRNLGLNCDDKMNEPLCCRYPLTVDFEEFGYDFIIAPKKYEAHYCSGECPYVTLQRHPHTHLLKMASPNSAGPCCAPRKMSAISMLYFDQQYNVVYASLPGMVVDRCGCS